MGDETVDPEHQSEGDNKEGLYFGRDLPADCEEARKPMHGPNQWPDAVVLPDFKPVVTAYFDAVCVCSGNTRFPPPHGLQQLRSAQPGDAALQCPAFPNKHACRLQ